MGWIPGFLKDVFPIAARNRVAFVAFVVGLALSIVSILAVYSTRDQISLILDDLRVNREIEASSVALLGGLVDAETAFRGYLISREEAYLEPFILARETIPANASRMRGLMEVKTSVAGPARKFLDEVSGTFETLQANIAQSQSKAIQGQAAVNLIGEIKRKLDAARAAHANLIDAVQRDLVARRDSADAILARLLQTVLIACAGLALGAFTQIRELGRSMAGASVRDRMNRREIDSLSEDLHTSQFARDDLDRRMHLALATARVKVFVLSPDGILERVSEPRIGLVRDIQLPAAFQEMTTPEDREHVAAQVRKAISTNAMVDFEMRTGAPSPAPAWFKITISPADRTASGSILGAAVDISDIKEREAGNFWLTRELMHRSRNLMSILQSMATHSARTAASPREFNERFIDRLHAISAVQDLLIASGYARVSLRELVVSQMDKLGPLQPGQTRISGDDIDLNPDATHALGMALHELYVNSRAHGALANGKGVLTIDWSTSRCGAQELLNLVWREANSPASAAPVVDGFGRFLIGVNLPRSLNGEVRITPRSDGFICEINLPTAKIGAYERPAAKHSSEAG